MQGRKVRKKLSLLATRRSILSICRPRFPRKENFSCLIQFLINHANRPIYLRRWFPSIKLRERSCNLSRGMSVLTERRRNVIGSTYMILVYSPPATKEMQTWINSGETERYQIRCEHITCCILHVIQSRARWYATVPLREKRRSHYWTDHLSGRLCVRSASHDLRQSIVKWAK